jgi:hypoxanthine phosphoribosyltransferase
MQSKIYLNEQDVLLDAYRLGVNVFNSGFRPTFIVGLWRGGSTVGIAVQECLQALGVETDHISIRTSYQGFVEYQTMVNNPGERIRVHGTQYLIENLCKTDSLLIVDDVYSTGRNVDAVIERLQGRLKRNMPDNVKIAVLWNKPANLETGRTPDYYLHETDDWLVLPYELSGLSDSEIEQNKGYAHKILKRLAHVD